MFFVDKERLLAEYLVHEWNASILHRMIMMDECYEYAGVGIATNGWELYAVVDFGS